MVPENRVWKRCIFLVAPQCKISTDLSPCLHVYSIGPEKMFIAMLVYDGVGIYIAWCLISRTRAPFGSGPFIAINASSTPLCWGTRVPRRLWHNYERRIVTRGFCRLQHSNDVWEAVDFFQSGKTWKNAKKEFSQSLCLQWSHFWNRIPYLPVPAPVLEANFWFCPCFRLF